MLNFKCETTDLEQLKASLEEIHNLLSETEKVGSALYTAILSGEEWEGAAHKTGAAFLSLVTQLHQKLAKGDDGPVKQAIEGLNEYLDNDAAFYEEWHQYQEVFKT